MPLSRRSFLLAASAVVLAGCSFDADLGSSNSARGDVASVVVLGDSITEWSTAALEGALREHGVADVRIEGLGGRRIAVGDGETAPISGVLALDRLLADGVDPEVWVIELGTNDLGLYEGPVEYGELVDEILGRLPEGRPVVWVNTFRPDQLEATRQFNVVLEERIGERDGALVADWFGTVAGTDDELLVDGIHPNDAGMEALARLVVDSLDRL